MIFINQKAHSILTEWLDLQLLLKLNLPHPQPRAGLSLQLV